MEDVYMKRKLNSRVYELHLDGKFEDILIGTRAIVGLLSFSFPNFTYTMQSCMWHGKPEPTLYVKILDDNNRGHRQCMKDINTTMEQLRLVTRSQFEVLVTVTKCQAYFLNGIEVTL